MLSNGYFANWSWYIESIQNYVNDYIGLDSTERLRPERYDTLKRSINVFPLDKNGHRFLEVSFICILLDISLKFGLKESNWQ